GPSALPEDRRTRRFDAPRGPPANGANAPASRPARPSRPSRLRRSALRVDPHLRPGHRAARAQPDLPASGPLRTDHTGGRPAARMAGPICVPPQGAAQMIDATLDRLRDIVQEDVGNRGLRSDPACNLITATEGDFREACRNLNRNSASGLAIVTGFLIPTA